MKASGRECVIDASMLGMGRSPGNLCMELIMDYMNKRQSGHYDVNPVLDGIDDHIARLKQIEPWGYNTAYALSAKYNLHRNYAEFLLDKGRLRAKQINQILGSIEDQKKTAYDEAYIEGLYQDFQNKAVDDGQTLKELAARLAGKICLILAPGSSIVREKETVAAYIEKEHPVVISANFVSETYPADYVFCCNAMRYEMMRGKKDMPEMIVTSNLLEMCADEGSGGRKPQIVNYTDLHFDEAGSFDNSVILLLRLLKKLEISGAVLAGFDGYRENSSENYVADYMASQHTKGSEENKRIRECMAQMEKQMKISYLTQSLYQSEV